MFIHANTYVFLQYSLVVLKITSLYGNKPSFSQETHISWFKLDNRPNISCISTMSSSDGNASLFAGFQKNKFQMTSNTTTLFLEIRQVDFSDSGLYFCGFNTDGNSVIVSATHLNVQDLKVQGKIVVNFLCILITKKHSLKTYKK